jgi:hypothetical protein
MLKAEVEKLGCCEVAQLLIFLSSQLQDLAVNRELRTSIKGLHYEF